MLEKLKELLEVRKLISLGITGAVIIMALRGVIGSSEFLVLANGVILFYFGTKKDV